MRVRVPAANYQAVDEVLARFRELDRSKTGYISKEDCQTRARDYPQDLG